MSRVAEQTVVRLKDFRAPEAASRVSQAKGSVADQLVSGVQRWTSKARSLGTTTNGFVRSSPWRAVGAVALAGVAAGVLVARAARRAQKRAVRDESTSEVQGG